MSGMMVDTLTLSTGAVLTGILLVGYGAMIKMIFSECEKEHMVRYRDDILMDELDHPETSDDKLYHKYREMCIDDSESD